MAATTPSTIPSISSPFGTHFGPSSVGARGVGFGFGGGVGGGGVGVGFGFGGGVGGGGVGVGGDVGGVTVVVETDGASVVDGGGGMIMRSTKVTWEMMVPSSSSAEQSYTPWCASVTSASNIDDCSDTRSVTLSL